MSMAAYIGTERGNASRVEVVKFLFGVQGSVCILCGKYLRRRDATIDHVYPKARGGVHHLSNFALAHRKCNEAKADTLPTDDILRRHGRLWRKVRWALFIARIRSVINSVRWWA